MMMCNASARSIRRLGLGLLLLLGQIFSLARAEPNGWQDDSTASADPTQPAAASSVRGGAEKPAAATVLRGAAAAGTPTTTNLDKSGRQLKSSRSRSKSKSNWSKSKAPADGTQMVSQLSLDGMSVNECESMDKFVTKKCSGNCIMFNKMKCTTPVDPGGAVFTIDEKLVDTLSQADFDQCQQQLDTLTCEDFPIYSNEDTMRAAQISNSISIREANSPGLPHCVMDVLYALDTPAPLNPPCTGDKRRLLEEGEKPEDSAYWDELYEVLEYQLLRVKYGNQPAKYMFPKSFPLPQLWQGYSVNQVAFAVFDEPPCYHQSRHFHQVFKNVDFPYGFGHLEVDNNVYPSKGNVVEFIDGIIMAYKFCIDTVHHISEGNFALKWYYGKARPEEVSFNIFKCMQDEENCDERLPMDYVPQRIKDKIMEYDKERQKTPAGGVVNAPDFTAYPPGSPIHPSWPAMHSAASNWSFGSQILYNPTAAMVCEAIKTDYAVSWARTVAGVHYKYDNIDGLNIGQEQAARFYASYFMETGGDVEYIKQKLIEKRFDWREVDMEYLGEFDCINAKACHLVKAGIPSFAADVVPGESCPLPGEIKPASTTVEAANVATEESYIMPEMAESTVVVEEPSEEDSDESQTVQIPPSFDFNFANSCAANPWGP